MQERLRVFVSYGAKGFAFTMLLMLFIAPLPMLFAPVVFNYFLWKKLCSAKLNRWKFGLFIIVASLTTMIFFIQLGYRDFYDRQSCIRQISDWTAHVSYVSTMVLFSLLSWGFGLTFIDQKSSNQACPPV